MTLFLLTLACGGTRDATPVPLDELQVDALHLVDGSTTEIVFETPECAAPSDLRSTTLAGRMADVELAYLWEKVYTMASGPYGSEWFCEPTTARFDEDLLDRTPRELRIEADSATWVGELRLHQADELVCALDTPREGVIGPGEELVVRCDDADLVDVGLYVVGESSSADVRAQVVEGVAIATWDLDETGIVEVLVEGTATSYLDWADEAPPLAFTQEHQVGVRP